jgi:hypothetical protein
MTSEKTKRENTSRILSVKIKIEPDPDYPLSEMIGQFSNQPELKFAINHRRRQGNHDEFEWFNPACAENMADAERAYLEIMPFVRDRKWMMRIRASARVEAPCGNGAVVGEVGPCYADGFDDEDCTGREEAEKQVKEELTNELRTLGFTGKEIVAAIDEAKIEED